MLKREHVQFFFKYNTPLMEHHGKIIVNQYIKPEMTSDICFVKINSGNNYVADLSIIFLNIIFPQSCDLEH